MSASTSSDFVRAMGPVARELLGEPNAALSSPTELRYGSRGSLCIDLVKGTFFDNETGKGGGVLAFAQEHQRIDKAGAVAWLQQRGHISAAKPKPSGGRIVAAYDYVSREGKLVYQVLRIDPKDFRQHRPDGNGGWIANMKGIDLVIYRLPAVDDAVDSGRTVFIAEGEKAVHAIESLGLTGTCAAGGAGKWKAQYNWIFEDADVVVLSDNDPQSTDKKTGAPLWHPDGRPKLPGQDHAADVAGHLLTKAKTVRLVMLPGLPLKGDVADWIEAGGTREALEALSAAAPPLDGPEAIAAWLASVAPPGTAAEANAKPNGAEHYPRAEPPEDEPADYDAEIARLAKLDAATYERIRQAEAKKLNVRGGFLDKEVAKARGKPPDAQQGHALHLPMPEPWPEPIDGAALLVDLAAFFTKYAFLPHRASIALALWTAHTYTFEVFRHSPRLHIKAIAKNSGKTTVLDLLEKVVCRALPTAHATSAVLFRAIEMATPTLLIDEADTFVHGNEEVRGVLNAGHKRGGQVLRAVGDDFEPRAFRVFSPVAIAGIGGLPGTIADRCIAISMKRAMQHELPSPIRTEAEAEAIRLSRCTVRWVADHKTAIAEAEPDMGELFNRIADNWRPLYVIADIAGDNWPELVRTAAIELTVKDDDDETTGVKLLADIKAVLTQAEMDPFNEAYVTSKNLLERLTEMEDRPWAEFGRTGKAITTSRLARLLKPFLIIPEKVGPKDARVNGYPIRKFIEPFKRYLTDNAKPN